VAPGYVWGKPLSILNGVVLVNAVFARLVAVIVGVGMLPHSVSAQIIYKGFGNDHGKRPAASTAPTLKPDPRQRLDAGALLCRTEADLQQHEAAIAARLDGQEAPEPVGCRPVKTMTPVTVLDRHGLARTQVKLAGPPEQTGWTDAVVREAP
jgi:hypothetical protein